MSDIFKFEPPDIYFERDLARQIAQRETNENNVRLARIVEKIVCAEIATLPDPITIVDLGAGAHPEQYKHLFDKLLSSEPKGSFKWVERSPHMIEIAKENTKSLDSPKATELVEFIPMEMLAYLRNQDDESIDATILKYTIDHIFDIKELFSQISRTLKPGGIMISTLTTLGILPARTANVQYFYKGTEIQRGQTIALQNGDSFDIQFLDSTNNPEAQTLEGLRVTKFFHSPEAMHELAKKFDFEIIIGNWLELMDPSLTQGETFSQNILLLRKPK